MKSQSTLQHSQSQIPSKGASSRSSHRIRCVKKGEIFQKSFFKEHLWATASGPRKDKSTCTKEYYSFDQLSHKMVKHHLTILWVWWLKG